MKTRIKWISSLLLFPLLIGASLGGEDFRTSPKPEEYRLGTGDLIEISVFGVEDFNYSVRIGSSGTITLPSVGPVVAQDKTAAQLAGDLAKAMDGTLFRDPQVTVTIKEFRTYPITVVGAVAKPGTVQMGADGLRLIDALAAAGGVSPLAGDSVVIQRSHEDEGVKPEIIRIGLDDLFNRSVATLNIALEAGDLVSVPPAPKAEGRVFYVIGEVVRPGVFNIPPGKRLYLTQAVAEAGGTLKTAKSKKGILVRYGEEGEREELAVNFDDVLKGKRPDILVQERDVIFIPGSNIKTIGYGLLGVIPGVASQTASSGVVR